MTTPLINVTVPVFNEEKALEGSIGKLVTFLDSQSFRYELVVADNGSTDRTLNVANELATRYRKVRVLHLDEKGRGRAVKGVWSESKADILSYMDVDLSTDLAAFPLLIEPLITKKYDLAIGSRLLNPTLTKRGFKREFISRCYNRLVKLLFHTRFSDAQCGFKAITREAAARLLPLVEDNIWFMDTELLVIAEKLGYRIFDLPVRWVDDPDSRVKIVRTALEDIKGLIRLRHSAVIRRGVGIQSTSNDAPMPAQSSTKIDAVSRGRS